MRRRRGESGFALLLVFAMAAAIAILLYTEMPRVAFEGQRMREQLLIDRGEQYQRAIQLYFRKFQRFPARIEDLEATNNIRYLRRRYKDPMTGKDDWRLIHAGPGGILLDSKVQKLPSADKDKDKEKKSENTFITEALPVGSTLVGQPGATPVSPALARRASDRAPVSAASMGGAQGGGIVPYDPNAAPQAGLYPTDATAQTGVAPVGYLPNQQHYPGQPATAYDPTQAQQPVSPVYPGVQPGQYPGVQLGQFPGMQAGQYPGVQPGQYAGVQQGQFPGVQPGQFPGVQPGQFPAAQGQVVPFAQPGYQGQQYPNAPANSQTGGQVPMAVSAYSPQQQGVAAGAGNQNPALDLIRNLLTSPRPGGPIGTSTQSSGTQVGGGIAGVASKYEAEGIKVYNEKTSYEEWEFLYDLKNDRTLGGGMNAGMVQGVQGQGATTQQGNFGQSGFGQSGFGQSGAGQSGFGQSGFGQGSGFGSQPTTQQPGFGTRPSTGQGR